MTYFTFWNSPSCCYYI